MDWLTGQGGEGLAGQLAHLQALFTRGSAVLGQVVGVLQICSCGGSAQNFANFIPKSSIWQGVTEGKLKLLIVLIFFLTCLL